MKKLIVAAAALLISVSSFAQFGIIAGLTSSKTDFKSALADYKNITLYHVGVTYKMSLGNLIAIQPSLIYNVKGTKVEEVIVGGTSPLIEGQWKTGYLELPVQVQVGFGLGSLARIYGFAEPFIGLAISNTKQYQGDTIQKTWDNISNKFEYGVGLGLGVELFSHLQVSARYFWNLGNVYDFSWAAMTSAPNGKCNGITASVAYIF